MKKKIIGVVLVAMIMILPFMFKGEDAKAADSCQRYTNYYFFSDIAEKNNYDKNIVGRTREHGSEHFTSIIPKDAKYVSSGQVQLVRGGNSRDTSSWSLTNFWTYFRNVGQAGSLMKSEGIVNYLGHGAWFLNGHPESSRYTDLSPFTINQLVNASILPDTYANVSFGTVETNPNGLMGMVRRTYKEGDTNGLTTLPVNDTNNSYVMPALYYIQYDVCQNSNEQTYKVNQFFVDEDNNTIKEPIYGVRSNLKSGDSYTVSVPESIEFGGKTYTLTRIPDNATGAIKNADVDVTCVYKLREENKYQVNVHYVDENNKTIKDTVFGYKVDLVKGDTYAITCPSDVCPKTISYNNQTYTLSVVPSNAKGTIVDKDINVYLVYKLNGDGKPVATPTSSGPKAPSTPVQSTVTSNPKTIDIPMIGIMAIGIMAFGYAAYYYIKSCKKIRQM